LYSAGKCEAGTRQLAIGKNQKKLLKPHEQKNKLSESSKEKNLAMNNI
jgi:hypothetical protein